MTHLYSSHYWLQHILINILHNIIDDQCHINKMEPKMMYECSFIKVTMMNFENISQYLSTITKDRS